MTRHPLGWCLLAVAALVGCQAGPASPAPSPSSRPVNAEVAAYLATTSVPFSTVARGLGQFSSHPDLGGRQPSVNGLFQTPEDRATFIQEKQVSNPDITLPSVDFASETAIVVTAGDQGDYNHAMDVVAVHDDSDAYVVYAIVWQPNPEATIQPMVGHPYHYIKTGKLGKPVRFAPLLKAYFSDRPAVGSTGFDQWYQRKSLRRGDLAGP
ncbi:MAG: hypothetical protein ACK46X_09185 [Candidatus Sericytochromatia bacterium]